MTDCDRCKHLAAAIEALASALRRITDTGALMLDGLAAADVQRAQHHIDLVNEI